jgi:glycosyltransferase involved in cell wall biosynthesis
VKLLMYSHDWLPVVGGIQTITMLLAKGLSAERDGKGEPVEVTLATKTAAGEMNDSSLPFTVIRQPSVWQLAALVSKSDVVHVAGPAIAPVVLGMLYRKPVIIEHHNYQPCCPNGLLYHWPTGSVCPGYFMQGRHRECLRCNAAEGWWTSLRLWLMTFVRRWLSQRATVNIVVSRHAARRLELPRSELVYHGIPTRTPVDTTHASPSCFAYVGRLIPEKGVAVILDAAQQLAQNGSPIQLRVIGDGIERQHLEQQAAKFDLGSSVTFTGYLRHEELAQALDGVSATIMPSVCEEVAPLSAIEPMMEGRLLIAADIGGLGEYAGGGTLKFPPGDSASLAAQLQAVIENPALAAELGAVARERALQLFSAERMVREHLSIYRAVSGR